jgi:hypothetical protein
MNKDLNDLTTWAKDAGINPRMAQRYNEKLRIGSKINCGKHGVWVLTKKEWQLLFGYIEKRGNK